MGPWARRDVVPIAPTTVVEVAVVVVTVGTGHMSAAPGPPSPTGGHPPRTSVAEGRRAGVVGRICHHAPLHRSRGSGEEPIPRSPLWTQGQTPEVPCPQPPGGDPGDVAEGQQSAHRPDARLEPEQPQCTHWPVEHSSATWFGGVCLILLASMSMTSDGVQRALRESKKEKRTLPPHTHTQGHHGRPPRKKITTWECVSQNAFWFFSSPNINAPPHTWGKARRAAPYMDVWALSPENE